MKKSMARALVWPTLAGAATGAAILGISYYSHSLAVCAIVFIIISAIMALVNPLNSGPAFGGWVKASTTAIDGMNSDIRSRGRSALMDRMGAILFFVSALLTYYLLGLLRV